jgi:hypothetical protein
LCFRCKADPEADLYQIVPHVRHNAEEIHVAGGAGDPVDLSRDEAATAMQSNVFAEAGVHIGEKDRHGSAGSAESRSSRVAGLG